MQKTLVIIPSNGGLKALEMVLRTMEKMSLHTYKENSMWIFENGEKKNYSWEHKIPDILNISSLKTAEEIILEVETFWSTLNMSHHFHYGFSMPRPFKVGEVIEGECEIFEFNKKDTLKAKKYYQKSPQPGNLYAVAKNI